VPLPVRRLTAEDVIEIRKRYDDEYTRFYDRPVPGSDVEIMSYAVLVTATIEQTETPLAANSLCRREIRPSDMRLVLDTTTAEASQWAFYERAALSVGGCVRGPAIIAEDETSTLVGANWTAIINGFGYIELTRDCVS
jgi:N-methylhydantoinase A